MPLSKPARSGRTCCRQPNPHAKCCSECPNATSPEQNRLERYKSLWEQSCQAVSELCDLAGAKPEDAHDLWTLKVLIEELKRTRRSAA